MSAAAPGVSETKYHSRLRFFKSCGDNFIRKLTAPREAGGAYRMRVYFPDEAPAAMTNAYFQLAERIRSELIPHPDGSFHRIDRHKIAAGHITAVHAIQPMRHIGVEGGAKKLNAKFCAYVIAAFLEKWHEPRGRRFADTATVLGFFREHVKWIEHHEGDLPYQVMAQAVYLLERCCFIEMAYNRVSCREAYVPCPDRVFEPLDL